MKEAVARSRPGPWLREWRRWPGGAGFRQEPRPTCPHHVPGMRYVRSRPGTEMAHPPGADHAGDRQGGGLTTWPGGRAATRGPRTAFAALISPCAVAALLRFGPLGRWFAEAVASRDVRGVLAPIKALPTCAAAPGRRAAVGHRLPPVGSDRLRTHDIADLRATTRAAAPARLARCGCPRSDQRDPCVGPSALVISTANPRPSSSAVERRRLPPADRLPARPDPSTDHRGT